MLHPHAKIDDLIPLSGYQFNPRNAEKKIVTIQKRWGVGRVSIRVWYGTLGYRRSTMPSEYFVSMKRVPDPGKLLKLGLNLEDVFSVLPGKPEFHWL